MRLLPLLLIGLLLETGPSLAQQAPETMAVTLQGKGTCTTRAFNFQDNWHIESTADAGIKIRAIPADGSATVTLIDLPSTTPPAPTYSGTSVPVPKGGAYTLEITCTGSWQITALENGFTKNLAIGGATPYSPTAASNPAITGMPGMMPYGMNYNGTHTVAAFGNMGAMTSRQFTVKNGWELQWTAFGPTKITLVPADGSNSTVITDTLTKGGLDEPIPSTTPAAPSTPPPTSTYPNPYTGSPYGGNPYGLAMANMRRGTSPQATGGDFTIQVEGKTQWSVRIVETNGNTTQTSASTMSNGMPGANPATPTPAAPAPIVKLTDDQTRAVVLIKGDKGEGTGFLVKMADGPVVVTNIHVIANNPNLKITTNTGAVIPMLSAKGASDRDLAQLSREELAKHRLRTVGMVFQSFNLVSRMTLAENVDLPLRFAEVDRGQRQALTSKALERVGLGARMTHRPSELSGGEQQRAALARALINQPKLLLADEPTGNLDSRTGTEIMNFIREFNETLGMTIVMVTHERALAERYARRLIFLADGKLIDDQQNDA